MTSNASQTAEALTAAQQLIQRGDSKRRFQP